MRYPLPPLLLALAACSAAGSPSSASAPSSDAPTDVTSGTTETPAGPALPDTYALLGTITVFEGAIEASELYIDGYGDTARVCSSTLSITATQPATVPDGEPINGWWSVEIDADNDCDAPTDLITHLGLGAYDASLDVGLAAHELVGATGYGFYTQAVAEPLWLVGIGGTVEQLAGAAAPDPSAPVPDGTYELQALVLSPWPSP